jgi:hypothetical protein
MKTKIFQNNKKTICKNIVLTIFIFRDFINAI